MDRNPVAGVIILTMGAVCFAGRLSMKVKVGLLVFDCILFVDSICRSIPGYVPPVV